MKSEPKLSESHTEQQSFHIELKCESSQVVKFDDDQVSASVPQKAIFAYDLINRENIRLHRQNYMKTISKLSECPRIKHKTRTIHLKMRNWVQDLSKISLVDLKM